MNLKDHESEQFDPYRSMGLSAYWDAYAAESNPFDRGSPASRAFGQGWMMGKAEDKQLHGRSCVPIGEHDDFRKVR